MKSEQVPIKPQPVHLILETQEEIDAMFTILNHRPLASFLEKHGCPTQPYKLLLRFITIKTDAMLGELNDVIRTTFTKE